MLKLHDLLKVFKEGQIAEALFADDRWYIIHSAGHIWYYDLETNNYYNQVPLTFSNINAYYKIINEEEYNA